MSTLILEKAVHTADTYSAYDRSSILFRRGYDRIWVGYSVHSVHPHMAAHDNNAGPAWHMHEWHLSWAISSHLDMVQAR